MTVGICEPVSRLSCPFQREKKGETQNNNNNNNNRWWVWYNNNKGAALLATREKETKSSKKGSSLYLSFFFKCPVFCFVFFLLCCWNSSNWVRNESLFEKNKTGVIDFYIFFVLFFFTFQLDANGWNIISSSVRISFEPEQNDSRTVTFELPG